MIPPTDPQPTLTVIVVRSGGFAGLKHSWQASPSTEDESARWLSLLGELPWSTQAPDARPAAIEPDRFVYRIRVLLNAQVEHEATVPESALTGPWRTLVESVRDAADNPTPAQNPGTDA
ncbi:protealysin inhibitor emfourin [Subtercola vilae]|uniref:Uncharacterized protein n=1 Tax=Subtercola vilae TaxID=2056433 RepID=A0A4T2BME9_9MICO|nr:protealysin inhibitor emfourin [Subtercola vilae]TIH32069.1 hypothetical protein D4765_16230 [Subtercola vilae]